MSIDDRNTTLFRFFSTKFVWLSILALFLLGCREEVSKVIEVPHAGVACAEPLAGKVGLEVLQQGGNAIDALVATAFSMAVTYPRAGNIGGGGFLVLRTKDGTVQTLDFRETAPLAATYDMYWDENGKAIKEKSLEGPLACGIPGTVRGLYKAHQMYGSLPWEKLLQPAITFARDGFPVYPKLHRLLKSHQSKFKKFPEAYRIFYPQKKAPEIGDILKQPDLARTLELIAKQGDSAFYEGEIAKKIVASVQKHGGIFQKDDFTRYTAKEREPIIIPYRGYTIYSMPPPSSGGRVLQGILNTLNLFDLQHSVPYHSADYLALISEIEKHWYALRNVYLGDPDFVEIPDSLFASPQKSKEVASAINVQSPFPATELPEYQLLTSAMKERPQTTHISILDSQGNAVAMTYTLNGNFGSHFVAEGTGILLNNEMDDFSTRPGSPNMFGLVQGWANAIEPGKRMLSSMTPTIVEKEGKLVGILGTPGGSTIITSVLQILLNKIDYQMSLEEALNSGRFHHQWLPDSIVYEKDKVPNSSLQELRNRGFGLKPVGSIGDIQAIWRSPRGWEVGCDPRGTGIPYGF
ncbi:MAG: gamma-glutamyltransferase [Calditrichaeota bacterium]|nr:MAG: gamma-glutamyltransferase [Calditrichota bacterium]